MINSLKIQAVIFDMDGTLFDTEVLYKEARKEFSNNFLLTQ